MRTSPAHLLNRPPAAIGLSGQPACLRRLPPGRFASFTTEAAQIARERLRSTVWIRMCSVNKSKATNLAPNFRPAWGHDPPPLPRALGQQVGAGLDSILGVRLGERPAGMYGTVRTKAGRIHAAWMLTMASSIMPGLKKRALVRHSQQFPLGEVSDQSVSAAGGDQKQHFIDVLRRYLSRRYGVEQGIVIYDHQYTPPLLKQMSHRYILAEAVYAVLEVKASLRKEDLIYAANKALSVRRLERTSVEIPHAGGTYPAKPLFPILAGIVAIHAEWNDGLQSVAFQQALDQLRGDQTLSLGLALEDQAFELCHPTFDLDLNHGQLHFSGPSCSLAWFLFTLLKRLQDLGTCLAVDWLRYRKVLSSLQADPPATA